MNIRCSEQAYVRWIGREVDGAGVQGLAACQSRLQEQLDRGAFAVMQWQGEPAIYIFNAYWRFESSLQEMTLLDCIGVFRAITASRWERRESAAV